MKLLLPLLIFSSFNLFARILTVSNSGSTPAQYTTIPAAISAASSGDTIYIHGSANSYNDLTVNKGGLTFIGAGYLPAKENAAPTKLGTIYLDSTSAATNAKNCSFIGMEFNMYYTNIGNHVNILIDRCKINGLYVSGDNWIIKNCWVTSGITISNYGNIIITNNIFCGYTVSLAETNKYSNFFTNNLVINPTGSSANGFLAGFGANNYPNVYNMTFNNNIFYGIDVRNSGPINCTFNNNLTYKVNSKGGQNLPTDLNDASPCNSCGSGNTGSNNITNQNPQFVNLTLMADGSLNFQAANLKLAPGSPGLNAGNDGTDIGIYGGSAAWIDNTGMSSLPFVNKMNVAVSAPVNGNLNIQIKASTHN